MCLPKIINRQTLILDILSKHLYRLDNVIMAFDVVFLSISVVERTLEKNRTFGNTLSMKFRTDRKTKEKKLNRFDNSSDDQVLILAFIEHIRTHYKWCCQKGGRLQSFGKSSQCSCIWLLCPVLLQIKKLHSRYFPEMISVIIVVY